jgi:cytochrome c-type biogenesis protein CcmH/NrfG
MKRILLFAVALSLAAGPVFAASVESLMARSKAAEARGSADTAIRLAQSAIVADPARASSYAALGDLYVRENQMGFAAYYYGEALTIDPLQPDALKGLALADRAASQAAAARSLDKQ